MAERPDNVDDATLEYAAQMIEESSLLDLIGIGARRKRQREDAALRMETREELRRDMARHLRAMKGRRDRDAIAVLEHLATLDGGDHVSYLSDAWPLAWKRWVKIEAIINCADNCVPPETHYRITVTDRGRQALAERSATIEAA